MSNDLMTEDLRTLIEATKSLPHAPHVSTIHRWRLRGIRGIRLETVLIGGRRFTSREALARFAAATTAAANDSPPPIRSPAQRERAIKTAEAKLSSNRRIKRSPREPDDPG